MNEILLTFVAHPDSRLAQIFLLLVSTVAVTEIAVRRVLGITE